MSNRKKSEDLNSKLQTILSKCQEEAAKTQFTVPNGYSLIEKQFLDNLFIKTQ